MQAFLTRCVRRLCGYEPFYDRSEANMFAKIVKCHFKFHHENWKDISENAKVRFTVASNLQY